MCVCQCVLTCACIVSHAHTRARASRRVLSPHFCCVQVPSGLVKDTGTARGPCADVGSVSRAVGHSRRTNGGRVGPAEKGCGYHGEFQFPDELGQMNMYTR